jgi:hypothetical protein
MADPHDALVGQRHFDVGHDLVSSRWVEVFDGLVEHYEWEVFEHYAGERQALALPTRQPATVLTYRRLKTLGLGFDPFT